MLRINRVAVGMKNIVLIPIFSDSWSKSCLWWQDWAFQFLAGGYKEPTSYVADPHWSGPGRSPL